MHGHAYCREGTWQGIDIDRYWWSTKACENMNIPFYSLNHFSYFTVARPLLVLMMVAYVYDGYNLFEYAWIYECRMQYSSKPRVMKNVNAANFERILLLLLLLFVDFFPNFLVDFCHLFALNCCPLPSSRKSVLLSASRYAFPFSSSYRYVTYRELWTEIEIIYTCSISVPWLMMCCIRTKFHGFEIESPGCFFFLLFCHGADFLIWMAEQLKY